MEFYMKLPRTKKEFGLFMAIISIISVNIIAPLITCFEAVFHLYVWQDVLTVFPIILVKCRSYCSVGVHTRRENDGKNHRKRGQLQCTYYC